MLNPKENAICDEKLRGLSENSIELIHGEVILLTIEKDDIAGVTISDGQTVPCDCIFSLLGIRPNTELAKDLGLALDNEGYIVIDEEGMSSKEGVFAAGDITNKYTQQVASAVHEGAEAGQTINYYLYGDLMKNPDPA